MAAVKVSVLKRFTRFKMCAHVENSFFLKSLSLLCVRLTIKVKVGIPESFKVGWYPPKKTGSSHLNTGQSSKTFLNPLSPIEVIEDVAWSPDFYIRSAHLLSASV